MKKFPYHLTTQKLINMVREVELTILLIGAKKLLLELRNIT